MILWLLRTRTRRSYRRAVPALAMTLLFGLLLARAPQSSTASAPVPAAYLPLVAQHDAAHSPTPTVAHRPSPTPTAQAGQTMTISGTAFLRPRYRTIEQTRQSVAYMAVLDVSTSMSWNFAGMGKKNGQPVQCGPGPNRQHCGVGDAWSPTSERRIYAAKQSLLQLVDSLGPHDVMRLVVYSTDGITATASWSSDKTMLQEAVVRAGTYNNNFYLTSGEAPSASALYKARQLMAELAPNDPTGQPYQRAAIFMTDSVANSFLIGDGGWAYNPATDICPNEPFPEDIPSCHTGFTTSNPPIARPITAMGQQADLLKQLATVYMIALANVDTTGLKNVASAPNYPFFATAAQATDLAGIIDDITPDVIGGECMPHGGMFWVNTIDPAHVPAPLPSFPELGNTVVGYIYLSDAHGNPLPGGRDKAPLMRNPTTGHLSYTVRLAPGTYQMKGFVAYTGDDSTTRVYSLFFDPTTEMGSDAKEITVRPPDRPGRSVPLEPVFLDLTGNVCPN